MGLVGTIVKGAVAGAVGTLAMDLLWYRRYRQGGGEDGFTDWEFATGVQDFDNAGAPAQVGRKAASAVGVDLPDEVAGTTTNIVHWLTGIGYGIGHALAPWSDHPVAGGLVTGGGAFANSYATLGALGVYEPIWEYDAEALGKDLSAHLVFGVATAVAHGVSARR